MANRYFLNIGVNWGDSANWSDSSGGTGGFSVPTNVDDVFFDANSGNCTVNASARTAKTLDFTGYTNTITMTFGITVSGNVTLSATMTIAGASGLTINATGNLTSNGKTWPNSLTIAGTSQTYTLIDDWTVSGSLTFTGTSPTINGLFNINVGGSLTMTTTTGIGTATIVMNGTGTVTGQTLRNNLTFNTTGIITISGTFNYQSATMYYQSGTVNGIGSTIFLTTITLLGDFNNVIFGTLRTNGQITLNSDINIYEKFTIFGATTINGSYNINCYGGSDSWGGTLLKGTGDSKFNFINGNFNFGSSGTLQIDTFIIGNITLSGNLIYLSRTHTHINGIVKCERGQSVFINGASTFINYDKINFRTITISTSGGATTVTMNKFFSGSPAIPINIKANFSNVNYNIVFQDGFEKITKFTKISNCTVSRRGQLLCITDKSNKGGNLGVRYINQLPNGVPKNAPTVAAAMAYSVANISDPNFIIN